LPIISINDNVFYGSWTYDNVLEAMCANLKEKPKSCYDELNVFEKETIFGLSVVHFVVLVVLFVIFNMFLVFCCKRIIKGKVEQRIQRNDVDVKISELVQNYVALIDVKK